MVIRHICSVHNIGIFLTFRSINDLPWFFQKVYDGNKISKTHAHVKNDWLPSFHITETWLVKNFSVMWKLFADVEMASVFFLMI
jgi:hypothetical protein